VTVIPTDYVIRHHREMLNGRKSMGGLCHQYMGRRFVWCTGSTGTLVGHTEDISIAGSQYARAMLIFRKDPTKEQYDDPSRTSFCYPAREFFPALRPWAEMVITGSGGDILIYGPEPVRGAGAIEGSTGK
jgi:hypothetical protein